MTARTSERDRRSVENRTGLYGTIACIGMVFLLGLFALPLAGQSPPAVTFYMHEVLAQTTVLVVDSHDHTHPGLTAKDFRLSIDAGHPIPPKHVRVEGDEPIDLSILIDLSEWTTALEPTLDDSVARILPMYLPPASHVSVYFLDCQLTRTLDDATPDGPSLKSAVARGVAARSVQHAIPALPDGSPSGQCVQPVGLFDSLAFVAESSSKRRGHRVVLALSNGIDRSSELKWNEVRGIANSYSVAIFGLPEQISDEHHPPADSWLRGQAWQSEGYGEAGIFSLPFYSHAGHAKPEDAFSFLCSLTGGVRFSNGLSRMSASSFLPYFLAMIRGRYIVDFRPSSDLSKGAHQIKVKIAYSGDLALATGLSIELSALQDADSPPTTDETVSAGKRKILSPNDQNPAQPPKQ